MKMAEKEQDGRLTHTALTRQSYFKMKARGQWFGFSVVLIFSALAFFLFYNEKYGLGVTLLSANLVSIIAIFVADKYFHSKDEE